MIHSSKVKDWQAQEMAEEPNPILLALRRFQKLPDAARRSQKLPDVSGSSQKLPDACSPEASRCLQKVQKLPEASRCFQMLPGAPRSFQMLPEDRRGIQKLPDASRSFRQLSMLIELVGLRHRHLHKRETLLQTQI